MAQELAEYGDYSKVLKDSLKINLPDQESINSNYHTSETHTTLVSIHPNEVRKWKEGCKSNHLLSRVLKEKEDEEDTERNYSQYLVKENSLIYFEDWDGNHCLAIPENLKVTIMSEVHNNITEGAHGGYAKTYNQIAAIYHWPRMSRDIKKYVTT